MGLQSAIKSQRKEVLAVLLMFVVTACAGLLMRSIAWLDLSPIKYHDLKNAHSHIAFLGWIFPVIMLLFERIFKTETATMALDRGIFWSVILVNVLMFLSFLKYGYEKPSIILLSVHTILAIIYGLRFWDRLSATSNGGNLLAKMSVALMGISFLGPMAIPVIKNLGYGPDTMKLAIHFYLHFQYNGFFMLAVLAMMSKHLPVDVDVDVKKPAYLFLTGVVTSYFLTISWNLDPEMVSVGSVAAIIQLVGGFWLVKTLWPFLMKAGRGFSTIQKLLVRMVVGFVVFKFTLQFLVPWLPQLQVESGVHSWVIAFLHLVFLAITTPYILHELIENGFVKRASVVFVMLFLFLVGMLTTELMLAWHGSMGMFTWLPFLPFGKMLAGGSLLMVLSALGFTIYARE